MSCYEVDGNGNVKVHIFTVDYLSDGESEGVQSKCFTDYTDGWYWARMVGYEWEGADESNSYKVYVDYEWVEDSEDAIEKFAEEHETPDD